MSFSAAVYKLINRNYLCAKLLLLRGLVNNPVFYFFSLLCVFETHEETDIESRPDADMIKGVLIILFVGC